MSLEDLNQELNSITYLIGEATTDEERLSLEEQYSEKIQDILQQIEELEDGTA